MNDGSEMLAADRQRRLKEHLMNEIARQSATERSAPRRRRLGWLIAPPAVVAVAAAVALLSTTQPTAPAPQAVAPGSSASPAPSPSADTVLTGGESCPTGSSPAGITVRPAGSAPAGDPLQALTAAANAAAGKPAPQVKDQQFVYTETLVQHNTEQPCVRRDWVAADGRTQGLINDPFNGTMTYVPNAEGNPPSLHVPDLRYLATLPADPQRLLEQVYADNPKGNPDRDGTAFRTIANVVGSQLLTPAVGAAFCRAAAAVPGATLEADAVDAAGRHGIGVVRSDGTDRVELIFDRATCAFLGTHGVRLVKPGENAPPVGSTYSSAVLRRAITDRAGERPAG
ncbi:CU044_5270 family protein [Kitasatospora sp. NPDC059646]|uniref:CU044_5270 family protein n=1 Tax=Kitasatospora sp. NPDC059646 TaxID=3346893 RepID=UPI0036B754D3